MTLWLLERSPSGYDQFVGFVVHAETKDGAIELAHEHMGAMGRFLRFAVCQIGEGDGEVGAKIILASFSAGR